MDTLTSQPAFWHRRKQSEGVNALQEVSRKLDTLKRDLEETRKARESLQEENAVLKQELNDRNVTLTSMQQSELHCPTSWILRPYKLQESTCNRGQHQPYTELGSMTNVNTACTLLAVAWESRMNIRIAHRKCCNIKVSQLNLCIKYFEREHDHWLHISDAEVLLCCIVCP